MDTLVSPAEALKACFFDPVAHPYLAQARAYHIAHRWARQLGSSAETLRMLRALMRHAAVEAKEAARECRRREQRLAS